MADGSLNFDTKIDETGFDKGIDGLKDAIKTLDTSIKDLNKSITQAMTGFDSGKVVNDVATAESAIDNLSQSTDNASVSAEKASLSFEDIMKQMENVPIQHWEQASDSIDNVDLSAQHLQEELNQTKTSMDNVSASLENLGNDSNNIDEATQSSSAFNNMMVLIKQSLSDAGIILTSIGEKISTAFNNTESVDKSNIKIKNLVDRIDILQDNLRSLEAKGLYFGDGNYDSTYQKLVTANKELNDYKKSLSGVDTEQKKVSKSAKKSSSDINKVSHSSKKANNATGGLMRSLKLLRMSLMFSIAFRAFSAVTDGIKTGIQNLAQYSGDFNKTMSDLKSSLTQFKNAIGTAFAPIISVAVPYLVTFINYLTKAITTFGEFVAALTGQKTFVIAKKVQEDYAKSLNNSANAAKNATYSFDKLEVANKKEDTGNANIADMFTESKLGQGILDAVSQFKAMLADLFKPIQDAWDTYGKGVIDSFWTMLGNIKDAIVAIGTAFYNVWTNGTGYETVSNILILLTTILDILGAIALAFTLAWNDNGAGEALIQSIFDLLNAVLVLIDSIGVAFLAVWSNGTGQEMLGFILSILTNIFDTVTNLVTQFTDAWNSASTGQQIFQNISDVINTLLSYIDKITGAMADWASNIDFSPLLTSVKDFTASLEPLAGTIGEGLYWFFTEVLLPIGSFVIQDALPVFFDLLGAAIEFVNSVLEALQPLASWLWDSFLQPIASWTGGVIIDVLNGLVDALNAISDWINANEGLVQGMAITAALFVGAWKVVEIMSFIGQAGGLINALNLITTSLTAGTIAKVKDVAETAILNAMYAGDFVKSIGLGITAMGAQIKQFALLLAAKAKDIAETAAINAMYAVDFVKAIAAGTAALVKNVAQWIATTAVKVADTVATIASTTATVAATVATWAFNAALAVLTSPITLVVVAIGLLIAAIVLLIKNWDSIKEVMSKVWSAIVKVWEGAGDWFVKTVIEPIKKWFANLAQTIKETAIMAWQGVTDAFKSAGDWFMDTVIDPILGAFDFLWNGIKDIINGILGFIEGLVNGVIGGVNLIISALNSLNFDIPDWVPLVGGKSFGFNIPKISEARLPRLATGTVVPPTSGEFAAILGDNNRETEVVSPLSTMKQALKEALAESNIGNTSGGNGDIYLQIDGKTFGKIILPYLDKESYRLGTTAVLGGV